MKRVGPYELIELIGQGAMGAVWRARHVELGVERAVKLLLAAEPRRAARFEREVAHLARLRHPHVVAIHDAGAAQGCLYYAMDLVAGESLDALSARGRVPWERAARLIRDAARGVAALHAAGIVHRDLKPGNLAVERDGRAVVLDLGVAVAPGLDERLTRSGALVGTLDTMAPEQLAGRPATPRSDVYALGVVLWQLLTAEEPLGPAASLPEAVATVARRGALRPRDAVGDVPPAVDAVCARATDPEPGRRYADGSALEAALEAALADPAADPGAGRRRLALGVGALGLVALVAGVAGSSGGDSTPTPAAVSATPEPAASSAPSTPTSPATTPRPRVRREVPFATLVPLPGERPRLAWDRGGDLWVAVGRRRLRYSADGRLREEHAGAATAWAIAPDSTGGVVVAGGWLERWGPAAPARGPLPEVVEKLALTADGRVLTGGETWLRLLSVAGPGIDELGAVELGLDASAIAVSPDGARLAVTTNGWTPAPAEEELSAFGRDEPGTLTLLELEGLRVTAEVSIPVRNPSAVVYVDDERLLVGDSIGGLALRDARRGEVLRWFEGADLDLAELGLTGVRAHPTVVRSLAPTPDGRSVYSIAGGDVASPDGDVPRGEVRRFGLPGGEELGPPLRLERGMATTGALSPDGRRLAVGAHDGRILLYATAAGIGPDGRLLPSGE